MIELRVIDETHVIYEGKVKRVHFPGKIGEFEVARDHAPILSLLNKGSMVIVKAQGKRQGTFSIRIERGIMKLEANRILAMVELVGNA